MGWQLWVGTKFFRIVRTRGAEGSGMGEYLSSQAAEKRQNTADGRDVLSCRYSGRFCRAV